VDEVSGLGERNLREASAARTAMDSLPAGDVAAMLDALPMGLLLVTRPDPMRPHPIIVWANRALCRITGLDEQALPGARLRLLRATDPVDPGFAALLNALQTGEPWTGELPLFAHGKPQRCAVQAASLAPGKLALLTVVASEAGKETGEAADSSGTSRLLGDLVGGGLYRLCADVDAGLRLEWADPTVERLTGYSMPELLARGGLSGIVVPRDRGRLRRRNLELMAGVSSDISYRIRTAHGAEVRLFDRARPVRAGSGKAQAGMPVERVLGLLRQGSAERQELSAPGLPLADYRLLADLLDAAVLAIDVDLRLLWIATGREEALCRTLQTLDHGPLDDVLGSELAEDWRDRVEQALTSGRRIEATFQWPASGQHWEIVLQPMSTETVLGVVRPVRATVPAGEERPPGPTDDGFLDLVLDHVTDGVLVVDAAGAVCRASRAAERIFDLAGGGLLGRAAAELFDPPLLALEGGQAGLNGQEPSRLHGESRAIRRSGEHVPVEVAVAPVGDGPGGVLIVRDITLRKQTEETIRNLAYTDPLTGLPNRLLFLDRLSQAIERARRGRQQLAVMVVDLDRFKLINESLGLDKGDRVLRAAAARIGNALRKSDTVARPGSDEFLILALATEGAEGAGKVAQKTLDCLQAPFQIAGDQPTVAASIGISLFPFDGDHPDQLLKNAGTALARAKEQGSNTYQFYTTDMNAKAYQRLVLESRLRKAVERGELLLLHFQPLVGLAEDRIVGVEALLRWNSPELGMIPPSDFIPIAEETGLILPIGDWVLRQAVLQMREWHAEGLEGLRIAVNISARQFQARDFVAKVRRLLMDSAFPGPCLELELTESSIMQDVQDTVHRLHELGVRVTVDDFGTGYSSLAYLKRFPIGALKIDRSFIADVTTDPNDAAIARAVVALADTLRVRVVGEGVETKEQLEFLRELGCHEAQGFLIGRPLGTADAFIRLRENGTPTG
jgi:diguanylate cyclase (GGDEF)-like protein/PAS domain S-box-containing protein